MELVETSALTGQGVTELFKRVAIKIIRHHLINKRSKGEDTFKEDSTDSDQVNCR
jgi:hypothetical protein